MAEYVEQIAQKLFEKFKTELKGRKETYFKVEGVEVGNFDLTLASESKKTPQNLTSQQFIVKDRSSDKALFSVVQTTPTSGKPQYSIHTNTENTLYVQLAENIALGKAKIIRPQLVR